MKTYSRERRDWTLLGSIIPIGIILMLIAGLIATRLDPFWSRPADMRSNLDPDTGPKRQTGLVQPINPGISEPYDLNLTPSPGAGSVVIPPLIVLQPNGTPSATVPPSLTPSPTKTALPSATKANTATITPTKKPTSVSTQVIATATKTPTKTPTKTLTATTTKLATASATGIRTPTATATRLVTATTTGTKTPTAAATRTPTRTATKTATATATATKTSTPTAMPTFTPTRTATNTATPTFTLTSTTTPSPTLTPSFTPTLTATPTSTSTDTPTSTFTPTTTATSTSTPTALPAGINIGPPDGSTTNGYPANGASITLDLGLNPIIVSGPSDTAYDFVYYEWDNSGFVYMDSVILSISMDGIVFYQIFYWGDIPTTPDTNSNISAFPENDNEPIPLASLYGSPYQTGILVDVDNTTLSSPPIGSYQYLKIEVPATSPGDDFDGADIDAIEVIEVPFP